MQRSAGQIDVNGAGSSGPLSGVRLIELSGGIAGAYATKLLVDLGADVVKVEAPEGDPLRGWSQRGDVPAGEDGALFRFLAAGKRSVVADPADGGVELVLDLVRDADAVVWSPGALADHPALVPHALRSAVPGTTVLSLTPYGLDGPWADRPATEFTLQALCGGLGARGGPDRAPVSVGGRTGEWLAGLFGAVSLLVSYVRGAPELLDASVLEALILTHNTYPVTWAAVTGRPRTRKRATNIPAVHPTADGYVGLFTLTGQQWLDFCALVGRPDWAEDASLLNVVHRRARRAELVEWIDAWCAERTSAEIVELASLFRLPASLIGTGETVPGFDHLVEREAFRPEPGTGVVQPRPPYRLHGTDAPLDGRPAPRLGEDTEEVARKRADGPRPTSRRSSEVGDLPLAGLRVADITSVWAGPFVTHVLAALGADVVHVESAVRLDAYRASSAKPMTEDCWWEWSPMFHGPNTGKRSLAVDLGTTAGRDILSRLIARCDVVVENFAPRVMENWGFDYPAVRRLNGRAVMVRMPAFGLTGPWRDRVGYALTMEQLCGMAWITGHPDLPPEAPNGVCDPITSLHALVAVLAALEHRRRTGEGLLVEAPMVGAALNVAAEPVLEWSAYGNLVGRRGNRGPTAAPQNLYLCADEGENGEGDTWIALAVENDHQWRGLCAALGRDDLAGRGDLASAEGRHAAHDDIDRVVGQWCATLPAAAVVERLCDCGVPAASVLLPHEHADLPPLLARGFFEEVDHPVVGPAPHPGFAVRMSAGPARWHRGPAPLLGQHNAEVLRELGYHDDEIAAFVADGTVAERVSS